MNFPSTINSTTDMSSASQTYVIARIPRSQSLVNDHAPVERGRKRGYFKDPETRTLLGLNMGDFLRADSTYGDKELADRPVDFAQLREGSYDHCFLPFVPKRHGSMRSVYVELRETNKQWRPVALPLPKYAFHLLPLIRVEFMGSPPFEFQFQPWFDPEALHARWRRIE
jgi:hypothetical protein